MPLHKVNILHFSISFYPMYTCSVDQWESHIHSQLLLGHEFVFPFWHMQYGKSVSKMNECV